MRRKEASALIEYWTSVRSCVRHKKEGYEQARDYLELGVIAYQHPVNDGTDDKCFASSIGVNEIAAIYTSPATNDESPQDRYAKAVEKVADVMERQQRDQERGEEWRDDLDTPE